MSELLNMIMEWIKNDGMAILLILGCISILLHALEAGCKAAGWTKYEGIFSKLVAFIKGFLGNIKPPAGGATASVIVFLFICGTAYAQLDLLETAKKVPDLKQGIAFSLIDNQVNYLSTAQIAEWKGISLEGGYAGTAKDTGNKVVAVISYPLLKLKNYISLPVLDLIELNLGVYAGYGRILGSNEFDAGISGTAINLKF